MLKLNGFSLNQRGLASILGFAILLVFYWQHEPVPADSLPENGEIVQVLYPRDGEQSLLTPEGSRPLGGKISAKITAESQDIQAYQALINGDGSLLTPEEDLLGSEVFLKVGDSRQLDQELDYDEMTSGESLVVVTCSAEGNETRNSFSKDLLSVVVSAVRIPGCQRHEFKLR
jgi:hypothetical protein